MLEMSMKFFERHGVPYETAIEEVTDDGVWYQVIAMPERNGTGLCYRFSECYIEGTKFDLYEDEFPEEETDLQIRGVEHISGGGVVPHFYVEDEHTEDGVWVRYTPINGDSEVWTYE